MSAVDLWLMCRGQEGRHLIAAGGIGDQPATLWDAFETIARLWDEWDSDDAA